MGTGVSGAVRAHRLRSRVLRIHIPLRRMPRVHGKIRGIMREGVFPKCIVVRVVVGSSA